MSKCVMKQCVVCGNNFACDSNNTVCSDECAAVVYKKEEEDMKETIPGQVNTTDCEELEKPMEEIGEKTKRYYEEYFCCSGECGQVIGFQGIDLDSSIGAYCAKCEGEFTTLLSTLYPEKSIISKEECMHLVDMMIKGEKIFSIHGSNITMVDKQACYYDLKRDYERMRNAQDYSDDPPEYMLPTRSGNGPVPSVTFDKDEAPIVRYVRHIFAEALIILSNKNHDYSTETDPLANLRAGAQLLGIPTSEHILAIVASKTQRLVIIGRKGEHKVEDEGPKDNVRDIINYMALYEKALEEERDASI